MPIPYRLIDVRPFSPKLGAEIRGVALASGVSDAVFAEIHRAFLEYRVLFFKQQSEIPPPLHIAFAKRFGSLHAHPAAPTMKGFPEIFEIHTHKDSAVANGEFWHSDVSCDECPPLGTMLQLHILPSCGGDTLFSDMYRAFETLSAPLQKMLAGLTATHASAHVYRGRYADRGQRDAAIHCPVAQHPVVRTHPETGRRALYVNRTFTTHINELSPSESEALLSLLHSHSECVDFQIRFRWAQHDVAFWDNRCCMHYAVWDYWPQERKGRRVTIAGEAPFFKA